MITLSNDFIRKNVAPSDAIFHRGLDLYQNGAFACVDSDPEKGRFVYDVDGRYGDYTTQVQLLAGDIDTSCDCPFPGKGCKHTIAALLDVEQRLKGWEHLGRDKTRAKTAPPDDPCLTAEEIRAQALDDRKKRARNEGFKAVWGDMFKGEHLVETPKGKQYLVTLHDPSAGMGHCTCPDYETNRLNTCKHLLFLQREIQRNKKAAGQIAEERFPFVDIYWDSAHQRPRLFCERPAAEVGEARDLWKEFFTAAGDYRGERPADLMDLLGRLDGNKRVRFQESLLNRIEHDLLDAELEQIPEDAAPALARIKAKLYPYQLAGVQFALRKKAALIGDEMGLGKTLQAIALGILKQEMFGFNRILVVTLASLKEQWKREIERFTNEKAAIVAGNPMQRRAVYEADDSLFKITNYEAVLRDVTVISGFNPDLMILDEASADQEFQHQDRRRGQEHPAKARPRPDGDAPGEQAGGRLFHHPVSRPLPALPPLAVCRGPLHAEPEEKGADPGLPEPGKPPREAEGHRDPPTQGGCAVGPARADRQQLLYRPHGEAGRNPQRVPLRPAPAFE